MKKYVLILICLLFMKEEAYAQNSHSPYKLRTTVDLPVTVGSAALSYIGLKYVLREKRRVDSLEVVSLDRNDVNAFDRGATRQDLHNGSVYSDIALFSSFAIPGLLLFDDKVKSDALKIGALYLETIGIMGVVYTWGAGSINRYRPYVYNPEVDFEKRTSRGALNSFFAGHPAAAAASSFFLAKVYSDYNPDSRLRPWLFAAAIVPPSVVAFYRYKGGQHFPTDILAGIPIGVLIGWGVPHLHKKKKKEDSNLSITPYGRGVSIIYSLR
ncbi:MAG TPA: phosphatase PAP2 family protein [Cytophagaceae bacterium]